MRGDELVGLWRVIRAVEASPNESIVTEVVGPDDIPGSLQMKGLPKACSKTGMGSFVFGNQ